MTLGTWLLCASVSLSVKPGENTKMWESLSIKLRLWRPDPFSRFATITVSHQWLLLIGGLSVQGPDFTSLGWLVAPHWSESALVLGFQSYQDCLWVLISLAQISSWALDMYSASYSMSPPSCHLRFPVLTRPTCSSCSLPHLSKWHLCVSSGAGQKYWSHSWLLFFFFPSFHTPTSIYQFHLSRIWSDYFIQALVIVWPGFLQWPAKWFS